MSFNKCRLTGIGFFLTFVSCFLFMNGFSQVVDCIVAEVNDEVVTLTDLKVIRLFGLFGEEAGERGENSDRAVLERVIDQKVVIDLAQEKISVGKEESDALLEEVIKSWGKPELQNQLNEFGLDLEDLRAYIEERLLCQKIISLRFSQSVNVNLKEIEAYYLERYLPSQKERGLEPKPMMQILDEIETRIREEKMGTQVKTWISNLRRQADIRVNEECLKENRIPKG